MVMFRKHSGVYFIRRFREFDEARVYVEDMSGKGEDVLSAIDYMITHNHHYFLLKNLLRNIENKTITIQVFEYALLSYGKCPCSPEELQILKRIIEKADVYFVVSLLEFLKVYQCEIQDFLLQFKNHQNPKIRKLINKMIKRCRGGEKHSLHLHGCVS